MKLYASPMVGCRRYFADTDSRRLVLFIGRHSYKTEWLATGFVIRLGRRVALLTRANR